MATDCRPAFCMSEKSIPLIALSKEKSSLDTIILLFICLFYYQHSYLNIPAPKKRSFNTNAKAY